MTAADLPCAGVIAHQTADIILTCRTHCAGHIALSNHTLIQTDQTADCLGRDRTTRRGEGDIGIGDTHVSDSARRGQLTEHTKRSDTGHRRISQREIGNCPVSIGIGV